MKTEETNKLIAEFMEWEYKVLPVYSDDKFLGRKNIYNTPFKKHLKNKAFTTTFSENELVFHNDWNWLMEVVEKIESLNYSIEINKQEENDYQCLVVQKDIKVQTFSKIKIEAVYNACVEFIKFYNEQAK